MKTRLLIIIGISLLFVISTSVVIWPEYGMVCNNAVVAHLQKYSNLFDEDTTQETLAIEDIGYPFGVHSWNVKQCVDHVLEQRELDRKLPPCTSDRTACFDQYANLCDPTGWECADTEGIFDEVIELPKYDESLSIKFSPLYYDDVEFSLDWCSENNGFWNENDSACYFENEKDLEKGIIAINNMKNKNLEN